MWCKSIYSETIIYAFLREFLALQLQKPALWRLQWLNASTLSQLLKGVVMISQRTLARRIFHQTALDEPF